MCYFYVHCSFHTSGRFETSSWKWFYHVPCSAQQNFFLRNLRAVWILLDHWISWHLPLESIVYFFPPMLIIWKQIRLLKTPECTLFYAYLPIDAVFWMSVSENDSSDLENFLSPNFGKLAVKFNWIDKISQGVRNFGFLERNCGFFWVKVRVFLEKSQFFQNR